MNKKTGFFALFSLFCLCVMPQNVFAYVNKTTAVVRVMDKVSGKTQVVALPVGETVAHDNLSLLARSCKQSDPFDAENHFVFIEIYTKSDGRIFSGWMNRNEPGQNPLQDDVYDVWLEKCE